MLKSFPLLLVAIIAYNALIFGGAVVTGTDATESWRVPSALRCSPTIYGGSRWET